MRKKVKRNEQFVKKKLKVLRRKRDGYNKLCAGKRGI
jgi:hypothetical protein